ncbi:hypothetical protein Rhe02_59060 [Rhizocola hellebori]|uniref:Uncharacterized protein n=1 Tax=Rhizocola hellebori TaxID=1392758 RepID=A0A8J3VHW4_9ACTN|nr:hypothetical protein [Rhizocola hellebori]GIH07839.1 hypothetical protein Rhe02_59060 [Rhizocola hellebori]
MTPLERRCRRLLLAYPPGYRAERGDEIVSTLLDEARPGQRYPTLRDAIDLLIHATRRRVGVTADFDAGLAIAAPWALAIAAGISAFVWWQVEPLIPTVGPAVYAAWVLAAMVARRFAVAMAVAITAIAPFAALSTSAERPPLWIVVPLIVLGLITCGGMLKPTAEQRLNIVASAAAIAVTCAPIKPALPGYYQPVLTRVGIVVAVGVLAMMTLALRRGRPYLYAALLLAVPAAWFGPIDAVNWQIGLDYVTAARFGRLAHVVTATCVVIAMLSWLSRQSGTASRASGLALGGGAGYTLFLTLTLDGAWPSASIATVTALGLLGLLLGRPSLTASLIGAATYFTLGVAVGVYSNNWSSTWPTPARTAVLVAMLSLLPCAYAAFHLLRATQLTWRHAAAMVVSLGWTGYLTVPAVMAWGPLLWVLTAVTAIAAIRRRISHEPGSIVRRIL